MSTANLRVDPTNADQARAWDGDEGAFWADHAVRFDDALAAYDDVLFEAAAVAPSSRVLDIGCGTGGTTRAAAKRAPSGRALGVDLSCRMIEYAVRAAVDEGVLNARFEQGDAQVHPFEDAMYDIAISRTGTMFFGDPVAAFSNIARALTPEGRLVMLVWQALDQNEWISEFRSAMAAGRELPVPPPDAPTPFSLSDPDRARRLLDTAGFSDVTVGGVSAPMYFGRDDDEALGFVLGTAGWMLDGLDDDARTGALAALRATIARHADDDGVRFGSAMWLIEAHLVVTP